MEDESKAENRRVEIANWSSDPVFGFIKSNPGMAATLLVLILALLKLGAVTRYDATTMVAVASSGPSLSHSG
jgi:hypothetical protein